MVAISSICKGYIYFWLFMQIYISAWQLCNDNYALKKKTKANSAEGVH